MSIKTEAGVPMLETARTILRPHRLGDFETYAAIWAEPAVTRFIGGKPRTREESWLRFLRHAGLLAFVRPSCGNGIGSAYSPEDTDGLVARIAAFATPGGPLGVTSLCRVNRSKQKGTRFES